MTLKDFRLKTFANLVHWIYRKDPRDYHGTWEGFWSSIRSTGMTGQVMWDSIPEDAAHQDYEHFKGYFNRALPLLDIGCGNGGQTRFFAQHFSKVIGIDVSEAAVALARRETINEKNVEYRVLNVTHIEDAKALAKEIGPVNIYMRGVLHVIQPPDRPAFITSLEALLGNTESVLYQNELMKPNIFFFKDAPGKSISGLPATVQRVVRHGIKSIGFQDGDTTAVYPKDRWEIIQQDNAVINTIPLDDGKRIQVQTMYSLLRLKNGVNALQNSG